MPINTNVTPLKCKKEVVIKVEYSDLEQYIDSITGKYLEIPPILECGNSTVHSFLVEDNPKWLSEKDKKNMEAFLFGDATDIPTYELGKLLHTMCIHGLLEKGKYLINVSW